MSSIKIFFIAFAVLLVLAWLVISLVLLIKTWRPMAGARGSFLVFVQAIPMALVGTAFLLAMGFWTLLVSVWYWLLRKPIPEFRREDFRNDKDVD